MNNKKIYDIYLKLINDPELFKLWENNSETSSLLDELLFETAQINLMPSDKTTISCHRCNNTNAPAFVLKKTAGKYIALCVDDSGGCASREITLQCEYIDNMSSQCTEVAEWKIFFGEEGSIRTNSCSTHIGLMLSDHHNTHKIFPIEVNIVGHTK